MQAFTAPWRARLLDHIYRESRLVQERLGLPNMGWFSPLPVLRPVKAYSPQSTKEETFP